MRGFLDRAALAALRKRGVYSWSLSATRAAVLSAVLAVLLFWGDDLCQFAVQSPGGDFSLQGISAAGECLALGCVVTSAVAALVFLLVSVAQTRGAWGVSVLLSNQRPGRRRNVAGIIGLCVVTVCMVSWVVFESLGPWLLLLRAYNSNRLWESLGEIFHGSVKLLVVASAVLAILLGIAGRLVFLVRVSRRHAKGLD